MNLWYQAESISIIHIYISAVCKDWKNTLPNSGTKNCSQGNVCIFSLCQTCNLQIWGKPWQFQVQICLEQPMGITWQLYIVHLPTKTVYFINFTSSNNGVWREYAPLKQQPITFTLLSVIVAQFKLHVHNFRLLLSAASFMFSWFSAVAKLTQQ